MSEALALGALGMMLTSLLLPSALRAREADRRDRCAANLQRLGKAVHGYAGAHQGNLPSAQGGNIGWVTTILPYLGEEALYNAYKPDQRYDHPDNVPVVSTRLPVLECPEVKSADRLIEIGENEKKIKAAPTDYIGFGITVAVRQLFPPDFDLSGALLTIQSRTTARIDNIPDGLAFTGFVFESADKNNVWQAGKLIRERRGQAGAWAAGAFNAFRGFSYDGLQVPGPCALNCNNQLAVYGFHREGANIVMGDGAVRFFQQGMDVMVMYALISRNGGEILSESDF